MANQNSVTREGFDKMQAELDELKGPVRRRIAEAIREAKAHGDLRENAAYHEAKLNQSRLEARIAELEKAVQLARVVDHHVVDGKIQLSSKVRLVDLEFDDEFSVTLVGSFEADPSKELISIGSPLGEALVGRESGEEVQVIAPEGTQRYRIVGVE